MNPLPTNDPVLLNYLNWCEQLEADPEAARLKLSIAIAGRALATEVRDSPAYTRAHELDREYRQLLRELEQTRFTR